MRRLLNFIFSILLLFFGAESLSYAQNTPIDSLELTQTADTLSIAHTGLVNYPDSLSNIKLDSITPKVLYPLLREFALLLDYGKVLGYLTGFEKKNEIGISLNIKKSFVVMAEVGFSTLNPNDSYINADYEVKGNYFRMGGGVTKKIKAKNNISFSVLYASAKFDDVGIASVSSASGIFDNYEKTFTTQGLSASWYEFVMGSESRIRPKDINEKPKLYLGFYFRLRVIGKYDVQQPFDVFTIPGYGRTFDKTVPALNLYLKYVIGSKNSE
ncbi:MAG: DUF6048 family protein [Cyclobacteriaceae bacterium]|nr:DUF6048 family protein [Cyclobacteriaceae bacterium]